MSSRTQKSGILIPAHTRTISCTSRAYGETTRSASSMRVRPEEFEDSIALHFFANSVTAVMAPLKTEPCMVG